MAARLGGGDGSWEAQRELVRESIEGGPARKGKLSELARLNSACASHERSAVCAVPSHLTAVCSSLAPCGCRQPCKSQKERTSYQPEKGLDWAECAGPAVSQLLLHLAAEKLACDPQHSLS